MCFAFRPYQSPFGSRRLFVPHKSLIDSFHTSQNEQTHQSLSELNQTGLMWKHPQILHWSQAIAEVWQALRACRLSFGTIIWRPKIFTANSTVVCPEFWTQKRRADTTITGLCLWAEQHINTFPLASCVFDACYTEQTLCLTIESQAVSHNPNIHIHTYSTSALSLVDSLQLSDWHASSLCSPPLPGMSVWYEYLWHWKSAKWISAHSWWASPMSHPKLTLHPQA